MTGKRNRTGWLVPLLFGVGLVVRLLALPSPGMVDVKAWKAWATHATEVGLSRVYGPPDAEVLRLAREHGGLLALPTMPFPRTSFSYRGEEYYVDYPPGSMILLWAVGKIYAALDPEAANGRLYNALVNLLQFAGSLAIAWILGCTDAGPLGARRALAFWCNPAVLLAAVLGYQDTIFGALALAAVVVLMAGRHVLGTALVVGAGLLKPQGILLVPILAAVLLTETPLRTWLRAGLAGAGVAAVVLAPWWTEGYLLSAFEGGLRPLGETTVSSQGLNVWWIAGYVAQWMREGAWPLARIVFLDEFASIAGWDARFPSRILMLAATAANLLLLVRRPREDRLRIPLALALQTHIYALLGTGVHENHAFLAVIVAPLLLGAWAQGARFLTLTSSLLLANVFLLEGLGRAVIRDRVLWKLRLLVGLDLTVIVAALHAVVVVIFFVWLARRRREEAVAAPADTA